MLFLESFVAGNHLGKMVIHFKVDYLDALLIHCMHSLIHRFDLDKSAYVRSVISVLRHNIGII